MKTGKLPRYSGPLVVGLALVVLVVVLEELLGEVVLAEDLVQQMIGFFWEAPTASQSTESLLYLWVSHDHLERLEDLVQLVL